MLFEGFLCIKFVTKYWTKKVNYSVKNCKDVKIFPCNWDPKTIYITDLQKSMKHIHVCSKKKSASLLRII